MYDRFFGCRLLLMGSSAFRAKSLPQVVTGLIDTAIRDEMRIIVGEAMGACRYFQDYLKNLNYRQVIVGYANNIRYNAGNWRTLQYGNNLQEREANMIDDCDSAIVIWVNKSGVIAANLRFLAKLEKPTFVYEYSIQTKYAKSGWLC